MNTQKDIIRELKSFSSHERSRLAKRFFKTGKGEYGENDCFLGVPNGICRSIASKYRDLPFDCVKRLLYSRYHEARLCALFILDGRFEKGSDAEKKRVFNLYSKASSDDKVNNWDLVDLSAPNIAGAYALEHGEYFVRAFAARGSLWNDRISVVATLAFIRANCFELTMELVLHFMHHEHDLMHKACGWMLREIGKRDENVLTNFIEKHGKEMPRTMLRYAIERYSPCRRKKFLSSTRA